MIGAMSRSWRKIRTQLQSASDGVWRVATRWMVGAARNRLARLHLAVSPQAPAKRLSETTFKTAQQSMDDFTTIAPEAPESEDEVDRLKRGGLFVKDKELIERLGVPEKIARKAIRMLDADRAKGFPQKQQLWGDRRYWPAVQAYFERVYGLSMPSSPLTERGRYGR